MNHMSVLKTKLKKKRNTLRNLGEFKIVVLSMIVPNWTLPWGAVEKFNSSTKCTTGFLSSLHFFNHAVSTLETKSILKIMVFCKTWRRTANTGSFSTLFLKVSWWYKQLHNKTRTDKEKCVVFYWKKLYPILNSFTGLIGCVNCNVRFRYLISFGVRSSQGIGLVFHTRYIIFPAWHPVRGLGSATSATTARTLNPKESHWFGNRLLTTENSSLLCV